jgi:hypothetical protein
VDILNTGYSPVLFFLLTEISDGIEREPKGIFAWQIHHHHHQKTETILSILALIHLQMQTYSAEYLAEDFSHWPRVGIYLTFFVAIFLMLLRIYARVVLIKWFGLDDFLMVLAVVIT